MCNSECYSAKLSVREFVEFMCRNGNIDNRGRSVDVWAMNEGTRLHSKIQSRQPEFYKKEVVLSRETVVEYEGENFSVALDGRADGVIVFSNPAEKFEMDNTIIAMFEPDVFIDEIKCMYTDVDDFAEPELLHMAQAKCYAWFLANDMDLEKIGIQITYCQLETEKIRYFTEEFTKEELEGWFMELIFGYVKWLHWEKHHILERDASIKKLEFPFDYREGQRDLVKNVYLTMLRSRKIYIEAPTGVGKTISTLFPAVKGMGEGLARKIFYTTARTTQRTAAEEAVNVMRKKGLFLLSVTVTAKEKLCILEKCDCNPLSCPRARGHEDRVNDAVFDLISHERSIDRDTILEYAGKHQVCPFEFCLDAAIWCDAVICDYNYCFAPDVYFRRFFSEVNIGEYFLLVDEAHNLVDRAREMYSAELSKEKLLEIRKKIKGREDISKLINRLNRAMLALKKECTEEMTVLDEDRLGQFFKYVNELQGKLSTYVTDRKTELPEGVLDFYFDVRYFVMTMAELDSHYLITANVPEREKNEVVIKLNCMNPRIRIRDFLKFHRSSVFFSATLLPVKYYMEQLAAEPDDYAVYAPSPFDPHNRKILIASDVSARYTRRNETEYRRFASYISAFINSKLGNYMVFFPSYKVMNEVYEVFTENLTKTESRGLIEENNEKSAGFDSDKFAELHADRQKIEPLEIQLPETEPLETERLKRGSFKTDLLKTEFEDFCVVRQSSLMTEAAREAFLAEFTDNPEKTKVGFCVMGGIFSEGIDLKADRLIGVAIVGTGLPMVCAERELFRNYYNEADGKGFETAYLFPGMSKVLQAGGRVIRTSEDVGAVLLLDDRFQTQQYRSLFPYEWRGYKITNIKRVSDELDTFWEEKSRRH